jgi:hypothetical protein
MKAYNSKEAVLELCFKNQFLTFEIQSKKYSILKKSPNKINFFNPSFSSKNYLKQSCSTVTLHNINYFPLLTLNSTLKLTAKGLKMRKLYL